MRKRIGLVLCISGILLLIQPDIQEEQLILVLNYVLVHYWPLGLIMLGINMMSKKQKPRRK